MSASLISLPSALCGNCGKRNNLSFVLAMVSGVVALAVAGASGLAYLGLAEAIFGKPLSMLPFLLMFPIAIVLATVASVAFSSICYVAYNAVKTAMFSSDNFAPLGDDHY